MRDGTTVTVKNLTDEELEFLMRSSTIQLWAPYNISYRCALFHRQFPDRRISGRVLRKVMLQAGLKKKVIKVIRAPQKRSARLEEFEDRTLELDQQVSRVLE